MTRLGHKGLKDSPCIKELSRKANKRRELEGNWGGHGPRASVPGPSHALVFRRLSYIQPPKSTPAFTAQSKFGII